MRIAIIGAGFTGLSAAYELSKKGRHVFVFEKEKNPGGLAVGYKEKNWEWTMEEHYHHWFTNDNAILNLAKEINYEVITKRPKTSIYVENEIYQLDSPLYVLKFPLLSLLERLRMGFTIAFLKYNPFWKPLEKYNATLVLPKWMGKKSYEMIWESLFMNKFGKFYANISLAWFWARVKKRTPSLAYPKGGFLKFAEEVVKESEKKNAKFYFDTEVIEIKSGSKAFMKFKKGGKIKEESFDKIIVTLPSFVFKKIASQLPQNYKIQLQKLKSLGATSLILRLNKPFLNENTYWLNVCDKSSPVMAIVEHTNYMDKKYYGNEHLLYLGNYKSADDKFFSMTKEELLKLFDPYLRKINPNYYKNIIDYEIFKAPFAQPIIPVNYSEILPPFKTPLKNIYLANIEQVYPWDRGTNYAVELGQKIAKICIRDLGKKF
jgi:protoporphyrinogen oxidase